MAPKVTLTILGSSGGVAKAVLSLLNHAAQDQRDPIHHLIKNSDIHLIDINQKKAIYFHRQYPNISRRLHLYQFDLNDNNRFHKHLRQTRTTHVIDVSWADSVEMLACCNELGIAYINSALEITCVDEDEEMEGFTLLERYQIFEENKHRFQNTTAILCSGMNPGIVQWMALEVMKKFPNEKPTGLYIVEEDNSFFANPALADPKTIYTTWSPECFLDEAILSYPMLVKHGTPLFLYNDVYELEFKVRLGKKKFYGCLMPHEEVLTLGKLFDVECGFLYKVNHHTTQLIKNNLDHVDDLWDWNMAVLDPQVAALVGQDMVGVLLVYPSGKERYMYNVLDNRTIYKKYGTNATYLQVASGVYGALASLLHDNLPRGLYYVDELLMQTKSKYGSYAGYHLGPCVIGENSTSDGNLFDRMRMMPSEKLEDQADE